MKRSKATALLLMGAAPLLFTACQREAVQVQEGLYTSVQSCVEATGNPSVCRTAFEQAQAQSADAAPQYASRAACEAEYSADQCVEQKTTAGHSFIGPMMAGFFLSQMMSNRGPAAAAPAAGQQQAAPAFRDRNNGWARAAAPGSVAATMGNAGRAGLTPVNHTPNRAVTASRGGFGNAGSNRSSIGG